MAPPLYLALFPLNGDWSMEIQVEESAKMAPPLDLRDSPLDISAKFPLKVDWSMVMVEEEA